MVNPSPRLRREDPPRLPPPVAPPLPPLPHSTGILFLGGAEKAVRTQGLGQGQFCSVWLGEHRTPRRLSGGIDSSPAVAAFWNHDQEPGPGSTLPPAHN